MMPLKIVWKKFGNMYICTFLKYELGLLVSSVARFNSIGEPFIVYWLACLYILVKEKTCRWYLGVSCEVNHFVCSLVI